MSGVNHEQQQQPPRPVMAQVVHDDSMVITEETLDRVKKQADDELQRLKRETKQANDLKLKQMKQQYDEEIQTIKTSLEEIEKREKFHREAIQLASKVSKDTLHAITMTEIRDEGLIEKAKFNSQMTNLQNQEEQDMKSWSSKYPNLAHLYQERERAKVKHQQEKDALSNALQKQKENLQKQLRQEEGAWREECNELNNKHRSNLLWGLTLGALGGFVLDRCRM
jgi:hypothetical protein